MGHEFRAGRVGDVRAKLVIGGVEGAQRVGVLVIGPGDGFFHGAAGGEQAGDAGVSAIFKSESWDRFAPIIQTFTDQGWVNVGGEGARLAKVLAMAGDRIVSISVRVADEIGVRVALGFTAAERGVQAGLKRGQDRHVHAPHGFTARLVLTRLEANAARANGEVRHGEHVTGALYSNPRPGPPNPGTSVVFCH